MTPSRATVKTYLSVVSKVDFTISYTNAQGGGVCGGEPIRKGRVCALTSGGIGLFAHCVLAKVLCRKAFLSHKCMKAFAVLLCIVPDSSDGSPNLEKWVTEASASSGACVHIVYIRRFLVYRCVVVVIYTPRFILYLRATHGACKVIKLWACAVYRETARKFSSVALGNVSFPVVWQSFFSHAWS